MVSAGSLLLLCFLCNRAGTWSSNFIARKCTMYKAENENRTLLGRSTESLTQKQACSDRKHKWKHIGNWSQWFYLFIYFAFKARDFMWRRFYMSSKSNQSRCCRSCWRTKARKKDTKQQITNQALVRDIFKSKTHKSKKRNWILSRQPILSEEHSYLVTSLPFLVTMAMFVTMLMLVLLVSMPASMALATARTLLMPVSMPVSVSMPVYLSMPVSMSMAVPVLMTMPMSVPVPIALATARTLLAAMHGRGAGCWRSSSWRISRVSWRVLRLVWITWIVASWTERGREIKVSIIWHIHSFFLLTKVFPLHLGCGRTFWRSLEMWRTFD